MVAPLLTDSGLETWLIFHRGVDLPDFASFPLLEAGDLPGAEDWTVIEALHCDDTFDSEDDRFATLSVASGFDD